MSTQTITEFLLDRIAEDEKAARELLSDLDGEIAESYAGAVGERGPFTPRRLLAAKMWAQFAGQSKWRNFAEGQNIARLADPARVLAESAAKRAIIELADEVADLDNSLMSEGGGWRWETDKKILRTLAAVYKDHPDYRQEWAL